MTVDKDVGHGSVRCTGRLGKIDIANKQILKISICLSYNYSCQSPDPPSPLAPPLFFGQNIVSLEVYTDYTTNNGHYEFAEGLVCAGSRTMSFLGTVSKYIILVSPIGIFPKDWQICAN